MSAFWDYVTGHPWAMERGTFDRLRMILSRHAAGVRLSTDEITAAIGRPAATPNPSDRKYGVSKGVAIVPIQGVLARHAEDVGGVSQPRGTSYEAIARDLATAVADEEVERILLVIESPGGSVNGLRNAVEAVRAARLEKPCDALIDGMGCSAAYWLAAACERVYATADAMVGSIGTVWPWYDDSAAFAKEGVRPVILRSGPDKAAGQAGEALKPEWIAHLQKMVDQLGGAFVASVTEFRSLTDEQAKTIASGSFWLPDEAQRLGLIDGEATIDDMLAMITDYRDEQTIDGESTRVVIEVASANAAEAAAIVRKLAPMADVSASLAAALPTAELTATTVPAAGTSPAAPTAGSQPAPTPDTPAGPDTMKITAQVLVALIAAHVTHAALISSMASGDPAKGLQPASEDEIRAAITKADQKALTDRIASLEAKATTDAAAHTAEVAALTARAEKAEKLARFGAGAGTDPGADHKAASITGEASVRAEWESLSAAQRMGFCDDFEGFAAWKKNAPRDRAMADAEARERAATTADKNEG